MTFVENATVVAVHGAWADGSSWSEVIRPLAKHGLTVQCRLLKGYDAGSQIGVAHAPGLVSGVQTLGTLASSATFALSKRHCAYGSRGASSAHLIGR